MSFVLEEMNIYCNCVRRKNMEFQCGVVSDVGTTRKVNQDSACIHIQDSIVGNVGLAVVCDGMGG